MTETKKKAMLSQPMAVKTEAEIAETRSRAIAALEAQGYEVVNTLFTDAWYSQEKMEERGVLQIPLCFLAKSLENMSLCHTAYFCKGWESALSETSGTTWNTTTLRGLCSGRTESLSARLNGATSASPGRSKRRRRIKYEIYG